MIKNKKKGLVFLSIGILNFSHGAFHIVQAVQSFFLLSYSIEHKEHEHNVFFAFLWAFVGVVSIYLSIKEYLKQK